ncbi:DNA gyrase inhibitor YacG [Gluconacetobacter diazotrophicus]|uniref:DNA gyrase inhibitor YacG n=1 Tax=Gluconacetobacter diazotrophicus TaxID=33996 RepID=UPI0012FE8653
MPPCPLARSAAGPGQTAFRPFCSKRCGDIDLGRWFSETYRVPDPDQGWDHGEDGQIFDENDPRRVDPGDEVG